MAVSKNQDNGQQLNYSSDKNPDLCFVKAAVDIRRRVSRANLDALSSIAAILYHDIIPKKYNFITDKHIHTLLQKPLQRSIPSKTFRIYKKLRLIPYESVPLMHSRS